MTVALGVGAIAMWGQVYALVVRAAAFRYATHKATYSNDIELYWLGPKAVDLLLAGS